MIKKFGRRIQGTCFRLVSILLRTIFWALLGVGLIPLTADALEVEAVSQKEFTAENPLTIQNLRNAAQTQISGSTTTIKTNRTVQDTADRSGLSIWDMHYLIYDDINYNRAYTYYAMATDRCSTATTIEFTNLTTIGDTGSVTIKYPHVGEYRGTKVGATVTYTVTYDPNQWDNMFGSTETTKIKYPFLQVSDSLYNGVRQMNSRDVNVHVEFFDSATGADISVKNSWFSISSLNPYSPSAKFDSYVTGSEQVRVKQAGTSKIEHRSDGIVEVHQSQNYAIAYSNIENPAASTWVDELNNATFTKATAVIYQENSFDFTIRGNGLAKPTGGAKYAVWWALSSSSINNQMPNNPIKSVDKIEAMPGETLTYRVSQAVNDLGVDGSSRYSSMSMEDTLPAETEYVANSAKMYKVKNNGTTTEVTSDAGSFGYDSHTKKLTYTFALNYLSTMELRGESYVMEFRVQLNNAAFTLATNAATSLINGYAFASNEAQTLVNRPELIINKTVDSYEQHVGQYASYTLKISNIEKDTYAKNVAISDESLPPGLSLDIESITVTGTPSSVTVNLVEDGQLIKNKSVENNYAITPSGNGFTIIVDYLPFGSEIEVRYRALIKASSIGTEIPNTATVSADNAGEKQDSDYVWINSSALDLSKTAETYEYRVGENIEYTLVLKNTQEGTIARNLVVDETSLPEGIDIDLSSVKIEGIHEKIVYPTAHDTSALTPNTASLLKTGTGFVWSLDYLPHGDPIILTFKATAQESKNGAEVVNRATASIDNALPNHPNPLEASATIWVNSPDLVPDKVSNATAHKIGDQITYEIDVTNERVGTVARNVAIHDLFETEGLKIDRSSIVVSDSTGNIITNQCRIEQNIHVNGFTIYTSLYLVNSDNYTVYDEGFTQQDIQNPLAIERETLLHIEFNAQVVNDDLAGKEVVNTVRASSDEGPGGKDDDIAIINGPTLRIDKSVSTATARLGDHVNYELKVTQLREMNTAKNIIIEDAFRDQGIVYRPDTIKVYDQYENDITSNCIITIGDSLCIETKRDLTYLESLKITYEVSTENITSKELVNTASARADNAPKVIDKESILLSEIPDYVDVTKTANPKNGSPVKGGQEIEYALTVTNRSTVSVNDIGVHDCIPLYTSFMDAEKVYGASYCEETNSIGWLVSSLAAGSSTELKFTVKVDADVPTKSVVENYATYTLGVSDVPKLPLSNVTNTVKHPIEMAHIDATKNSSPASGTSVQRDDHITYVIDITNTGNTTAYNVAVHDSIPANTTFVNVENIHGATYHESSNSIGWTIESLDVGATKKLAFTVKVNVDVENGSSIENFATYAFDTPDTPKSSLGRKTNSVNHFIENPSESSPYDKTGSSFEVRWAIIVGLALLCLSGIGYVIYQKKRLQHEKKHLFKRWGL